MENETIRGYLKSIGYLIWRLPIFYPVRLWLKYSHFTIIHYHEIDPDIFEKHIVFLKKHYNIISLQTIRDLMCNLKKENELPPNSLVITFDDGWSSNYNLLPIFRKYNHPVTIFLSTGFVDTNSIPASRLSHDGIYVDPLVVDETVTSRKILNHNEINDMVESGINFQSHGVNHLVSTKLQLDDFIFELYESRSFIEKLSNQKVFAFAYPYNEAGISQARVVEGAGYQIARKGDRKLNSLKSNKYLLNSIGIIRNCTIKDLRKTLGLAKMKTILF